MPAVAVYACTDFVVRMKATCLTGIRLRKTKMQLKGLHFYAGIWIRLGGVGTLNGLMADYSVTFQISKFERKRTVR